MTITRRRQNESEKGGNGDEFMVEGRQRNSHHALGQRSEQNRPWFAAFRAARMHDVIQKMSRVDCAEVFQYKLQPEEEEDVNEQTMSDAANVITSEYESPR